MSTQPPVPVPPVGTRRSVFDTCKLSKVEEMAKNAPEELNKSFEDLVNHLTKDQTDDVAKAWAIFMWMSNQNVYTETQQDADDTSPAGFLNLVATKQKDLAELFDVLCRQAGLHSVVLRGYCKWYGPYGESGPEEPEVNSSWNAVHLNGHWRLVHPLLAFRDLRLAKTRDIKIETSDEAVRDRMQTIKGFVRKDCFLQDPDEFIYMCRPEDDAFQLLGEDTFDWKTFITAPMYKPVEEPRAESPLTPIQPIAVPDFEQDYPPPTPVTRRKTDVVKEMDLERADANGKSARWNNCEDFDQFFAGLYKGLSTHLQKVRAIFAWMSHNAWRYDAWSLPPGVYKSTVKKVDDPNTPLGVFKLRYSGRLDRYQLFAHFCRLAGIPCVIIRGCCKRADVYSLGQKDISTRHVWNAVHLDGEWRLVNLADAISCMDHEEYEATDNKGVVRLQSSTDWSQKITEFHFLTDPDQLVHFCLPDDPRWQLLDNPVTKEQFFNEPWIHPAYFSSPWRVSPDCGVSLHAQDGVGSLVLSCNSKTSCRLRYNLYYRPDDSGHSFPSDLQVESYIRTARPPGGSGQQRSLFTRLPVVGTYLLELLSAENDTLFKMLIKCEGDVQNVELPPCPNGSFGPGQEAEDAGLDEPSFPHGVLVAKPGDKVQPRFRQRSSRAKQTKKSKKGGGKVQAAEGEKVAMQFEARLAHATLPSESLQQYVKVDQRKRFLAVEVTIPTDVDNPEFSVQINAREKGTDDAFKNIVNYYVTSDHKVAAAAAGMDVRDLIKTEMEAAVEDNDVHRLEVALREVRHASPPIDFDNDVNQRAEQRLMELHQEAFQKAALSGNLDDLCTALQSCQKSVISKKVKQTPWFHSGQIHAELAEAAKDNNVARLEDAVRQSREDRMPHIPTEGQAQQQAQKSLVELHRKVCEEAIATGTTEELDKAIMAVNQSEVAVFIHKTGWFSQAQESLRQKKRAVGMKKQPMRK